MSENEIIIRADCNEVVNVHVQLNKGIGEIKKITIDIEYSDGKGQFVPLEPTPRV